eukprot:CFRG3020T1
MSGNQDIRDIQKLMYAYENLLSYGDNVNSKPYFAKLRACQSLLQGVCDRILSDERVSLVDESTLTTLLMLLGHVVTSNVLHNDFEDSELIEYQKASPISQEWFFCKLLSLLPVDLDVRNNNNLASAFVQFLRSVMVRDPMQYRTMITTLVDLTIACCDIVKLCKLENWSSTPSDMGDTALNQPWPIRLNHSLNASPSNVAQRIVGKVTLSKEDMIYDFLSEIAAVIFRVLELSSLYTMDMSPQLLEYMIEFIESRPSFKYLVNILNLTTCLVKLCGWPSELSADKFLGSILEIISTENSHNQGNVPWTPSISLAIADVIDTVVASTPNSAISVQSRREFTSILANILDQKGALAVKRAVCRLMISNVKNDGTTLLSLSPVLLPRISSSSVGIEVARFFSETVVTETMGNDVSSCGTIREDSNGLMISRKRKLDEDLKPELNDRSRTPSSIPADAKTGGLTMRLLLSRISLIHKTVGSRIGELPIYGCERESSAEDTSVELLIWLSSLKTLATAVSSVFCSADTDKYSMNGKVFCEILETTTMCLITVLLLGGKSQRENAIAKAVSITCCCCSYLVKDQSIRKEAIVGLLWAFSVPCMGHVDNVREFDVLCKSTAHWVLTVANENRTCNFDGTANLTIMQQLLNCRQQTYNVHLASSCLKAIALLPMHGNYRISLVSTIFGQDCIDSSLMNAAVLSIPYLTMSEEVCSTSLPTIIGTLSSIMKKSHLGSETDRYIVLVVGVLPCILSQCATIESSFNYTATTWPRIQCTLCDTSVRNSRLVCQGGILPGAARHAFVELLETCLSSFAGEIHSHDLNHHATSLKRAYHHISFPLGSSSDSLAVVSHEFKETKAIELLKILLTHPSLQVRQAISVAVPALIAPMSSHMQITENTEASNANQWMVIDALKHSLHRCKGDQGKVETLLITCGQLGRAGNGGFLEVILVSLIQYVASSNLRLQSTAWAELVGIARYRGIGAMELTLPHFGSIAAALIRLSTTKKYCIESLAEALDVSGTSAKLSFNRTLLPFLLPECIRLCSMDSLRWTADLVGMAKDIPKLLLKNTHHIFAYLFTRGIGEELKLHINFILEATYLSGSSGLSSLLSTNLAGLLSQLVLASADSEKRNSHVILALKYTAGKVANHADDDIVDIRAGTGDVSDKQLSSFLQQHLLAIFACLSGQLLKGSLPIRQRTMIAFKRLLALLDGNFLYMMRGKVLSLLRLGLETEELIGSALEGWDVFLRKLSVDQLLSILNEVVFTLVRVLDRNVAVVTSLLEYVICEKPALHGEENLFMQVYILPEHPALTKCKYVVEKAIQSMTFPEFLMQLIIGMESRSFVVRIAALTRLRNELRSHENELYRMAVEKDAIDDKLQRVVISLIRLSRDKDHTIRVLVAESLGIVGAIDPGRMDTLPCNRVNSRPSPLSATTPHRQAVDLGSTGTIPLSISTHVPNEFALKLLEMQLVPCFLTASNTKAQDRAAYAIQELLRFCKFERGTKRVNSNFDVSQGSMESEGVALKSVEPSALWERLGIETREIVRPYVESQYRLEGFKFSNPPPKSFLASSHSFSSWVSRWSIHLINCVHQINNNCASERKKCRLSDVFMSCRGVVEDHIDTALFILPSLVLSVLCYGCPDNRRSVLNELNAVMQHAASGDDDMTAGNMAQLVAQTIFGIIGQLQRWIIHEETPTSDRNRNRPSAIAKTRNLMSERRDEVDKSLKDICQLMMAKAAYNCGAYGRALMHFEQYMRNLRGIQPDEKVNQNYNRILQDNISFLQSIYARLDSTEGMAGVAAIRERTSLAEETLDHECAGRWTSALTCHSQFLRTDNENLKHHLGLLKCHINLSHYETAMVHIQCITETNYNWAEALQPYQIQAALRLGDWESLSNTLTTLSPLSHNSIRVPMSYEGCLGQILLQARDYKSKVVNSRSFEARKSAAAAYTLPNVVHSRTSLFNKARILLTTPLAAATMESDTTGSYQRAYPYLLALHTLNDVEQWFRTLQNSETSAPSITTEAIQQWENRLQLVQDSAKAREPILNVRRLLLSFTEELWHFGQNHFAEHKHSATELKGSYWLKSARLARLAGRHQTAYRALLHAQQYEPPTFYIEKSKILLAQGREHAALSELKSFFDPASSNTQKVAHAKAGLLLGRLMEKTGGAHSNDVIRVLKEVTNMRPDWEKAFFALGSYYEEFRAQQHVEPNVYASDLDRQIMYSYGQSLKYGTQFIFRTMPKLLTVWLDYTMPSLSSLKPAKQKSVRSTLDRALDVRNKLVLRLIEDLPAYHFYTAFSQILSRICHTTSSVYAVLQKIIMKVLKAYPHQALWAMMGLDTSTVAKRQQRCQEILQIVGDGDKGLTALIKNFRVLRDSLIDVCDRVFDAGASVNIDQFRNLKRRAPFLVMLPLTSTLTATLPTSQLYKDSYKSHSPFPKNAPTIFGFGDKIEVLTSLQKPKKLTIIGSDGREYVFLCKPKDDLRTDSRVMEFFSMINKLLRRDAIARRQNLLIRTYAVVVLNHRSGMLEWVHHTEGFRHIIKKVLQAMGCRVKQNDVTKPYQNISEDDKKKVEVMVPIFVKDILPMWPSIFYKWFLHKFPEPTLWVSAKQKYAYSTAVMSIVGYILGLGDRHGENILVDSTTGHLVHVDFNCMFNAGKYFATPERVPFRLTHNMVDAFGLTGYEGLFRMSCENTLRILRKQIDTLMSVLTPFIHDPVSDWKGRGGAVEIVKDVRTRLEGKSFSGLPMSVEGEVNYLIGEATSLENLSRMYVGWGAYL